MKPSFLTLPKIALLIPLLAVTSWAAESSGAATLTDAEQHAGWKLVFDGVSTTGWRWLGNEGIPPNWKVENGCWHCRGGAKDSDLVTVDEYENFEFSFEWMIPKAKGNSGVKYRVQEEKGKGYAFGCEYQCMNDPEATDIHASGALYDVIAPEGKKLAPDGEFNQSKIVVRGSHVEHWLNGVKVVDAEFGSEAMNAALVKSHFRNSNWGKKALGHIALQNHGSEVFFRNMKIRVLPGI